MRKINKRRRIPSLSRILFEQAEAKDAEEKEPTEDPGAIVGSDEEKDATGASAEQMLEPGASGETPSAKEQAAAKVEAAGKKMMTNEKSRNKMADMIEAGGQKGEEIRNWAIDSVCGAATDESLMDSIPDESGKLKSGAKKICRILGHAATMLGPGTAFWVSSKVTPVVASFMRNMSDEAAGAIWDFGAEMVKDEMSKDGEEEVKAEGRRITKRQLKRIIREERLRLVIKNNLRR